MIQMIHSIHQHEHIFSVLKRLSFSKTLQLMRPDQQYSTT